MTPLVGLVMGSRSDWPVMAHAGAILDLFRIPYEVRVVSAHRTPDAMMEYARSAVGRGIEVIIAGAGGGAAHLPGMLASMTPLPVLGVPIDPESLPSIVGMPRGIAVGTLAVGIAGAVNAALLAASILGNKYPQIRAAHEAYRAQQTQDVLDHPDPRD